MFERRLYHHIDWALIGAVGAICAIGLAMIYSTTGGAGSVYWTQVYALGLGAMALVLCLTFDYRSLADKSHFFYLAMVIALVGVLFFGAVRGGSRRWLDLGAFNLQPSEFAKATLALMLAKMLGAEVIACASSADKIQRLKDLGADHVINYKETDFSKWAVEKFGKPQRRNYEGGVDVVINFTGGDTWAPSLKCVKRGGKILVCGATAGYDPKEDLRYIWSFELQVVGSNSFYDDNLKALMDLIQEGKMKPVIDEVLPLEKAAQGLKLIEDREVFGKVIITP